MTDCRRFESEGLEQLEAGLPLAEHFSSCPECVEQRASYEALIRSLGELGAAEHPAADWKQQVRRRLRDRRGEQTQPTQPLHRRLWPPAALAAAAALAVVVLGPRWSESPELALVGRVEQGEVTFRGESARPGDVLVLDAEGDPNQHLELRLYRNNRQLIARCPSSEINQTVCTASRGRLGLRATAEAVGRYQPVLLQSPEALPPPAGDLEVDLEAILEAGGRVELGDDIIVR